MKHLILLAFIAALVTFTGVSHAKKGGGKNGIQGTVSSVGDNSFSIDYNKKPLTVICDSNTKFMQDGSEVKPDVIKVGVEVGIVGVQDGDHLKATTVNIMSGSGKKKKTE